MKTKEEIKDLLLNSQIGIAKNYNYGDLSRFAFDVRERIKNGNDVFASFAKVLPDMIAKAEKVGIKSREDKVNGVKQMTASCFVLSEKEMNGILEFIEGLVTIENPKDPTSLGFIMMGKDKRVNGKD